MSRYAGDIQETEISIPPYVNVCMHVTNNYCICTKIAACVNACKLSSYINNNVY